MADDAWKALLSLCEIYLNHEIDDAAFQLRLSAAVTQLDHNGLVGLALYLTQEGNAGPM